VLGSSVDVDEFGNDVREEQQDNVERRNKRRDQVRIKRREIRDTVVRNTIDRASSSRQDD
jgi:hypothetical protein